MFLGQRVRTKEDGLGTITAINVDLGYVRVALDKPGADGDDYPIHFISPGCTRWYRAHNIIAVNVEGGNTCAQEDFTVGTRVITSTGHKGTIIAQEVIDEIPVLGVKCDYSAESFHSCHGLGKAGFCAWYAPNTLILGEEVSASGGNCI